MDVSNFLLLKEEHTVSADDAQKLNVALSKLSKDDIPKEKRRMVLDYLLCALSVGAIDESFLPEIECLVLDLQNS